MCCVMTSIHLGSKHIRTSAQILLYNDYSDSPFVLKAMSKRLRKIFHYLTIFDCFCLGTGPRSQDPAFKRNGVKVPGDRRIENGVSAGCN